MITKHFKNVFKERYPTFRRTFWEPKYNVPLKTFLEQRMVTNMSIWELKHATANMQYLLTAYHELRACLFFSKGKYGDIRFLLTS